MSNAKGSEQQIIAHLQAIAHVLYEMDRQEAMASLIAAVMTLAEMAISSDREIGAYLVARIRVKMIERAPARPGETIQ